VLSTPAPAAAATTQPEEAPTANDDANASDELLLDDMEILDDEPSADGDQKPAEHGLAGAGSAWLTPEPANPAKAVGGSLFERMSNLARNPSGERPAASSEDNLDLPRFLNR
jgi:hypothetical protein